jgi:hypothetical protein
MPKIFYCVTCPTTSAIIRDVFIVTSGAAIGAILICVLPWSLLPGEFELDLDVILSMGVV